jgi:hypothetical protein
MQKSLYENKFDRYRKYYEDPERCPLSQKEQEQLDRWRFADNLIRKGDPMKTVVILLRGEYKCSLATAYNDIRDAKQFFGSMQKPEKEYWRGVLIEMGMETYRMAKKMNDPKAMAMTIRELKSITGVDKESADIPDLSKYEGNSYQLNLYIDNSQQATVINLDKPHEIPAHLKGLLMESLQSPKLSTKQMLDILDNESGEGFAEATVE